MHAIQNIWNRYYKNIRTFYCNLHNAFTAVATNTSATVRSGFVAFLTVFSQICDRAGETENFVSYLLVKR
jgi:hypothetical protein